eukprot:2565453-Prymnesium_polylepis.2
MSATRWCTVGDMRWTGGRPGFGGVDSESPPWGRHRRGWRPCATIRSLRDSVRRESPSEVRELTDS